MEIKVKKSIQAALDSLEMALETLEDREEYTLNDVDIKDIWDIWEEASHQLETSQVREESELKHFADGFHEGDWESDVERPFPGLDKILENVVQDDWESVDTLTMEEFAVKHQDGWIYESPDNKIVYRRRVGSNKRQLKYIHKDSGPAYTMANTDGNVEWIDEDEAKQRYWYKEYVGKDEEKKN